VGDAGAVAGAAGSGTPTTAGPGTADATGVGPSAVEFPPGVTPDGDLSPDALAQAHGESVDERSYHLRVVTSGVDVFLDGEWDRSWQAIGAENGTHYRQTVSGLRATGNGSEFVQFSAYADGRYEYRRLPTDGEGFYLRRPATLDAVGEGVFTDRAERYVARFLATNRTSVEVLEYAEAGERHRVYTVVATGDPARLVLGADATVSDYRAEATIRPDGLVETLEVQYTVRNGSTIRDVRFSMRYDDVGGYDVTEPQWMRDARNASAPGVQGWCVADDESCAGALRGR
jgi:hypothetical protein